MKTKYDYESNLYNILQVGHENPIIGGYKRTGSHLGPAIRPRKSLERSVQVSNKLTHIIVLKFFMCTCMATCNALRFAIKPFKL